jgi:GNAT superfamily N-acetyltransferase
MTQRSYEIRSMSRQEVDLAVEWAAQEGWNPGLADAACFYAADPQGFLVGLLDGEPVACISVVKYDQCFGFLGFYIVKPSYRRQGFGIRIWSAGLDYLRGCNIGLDGVVAQQDSYRKSGFTLVYRNIRYRGHGMAEVPHDSAVVDLRTLPFATVEAYDRAFFPAPRQAFLQAWIDQPGTEARGLCEGGRLRGYGVRRKCREGYKIGPLFADTAAVAEQLYNALAGGIAAAEPVFLDIPEVNAAALALVQRHHMTAVFETARMYAGQAPCLPLERLYGVTSFELG